MSALRESSRTTRVLNELSRRRVLPFTKTSGWMRSPSSGNLSHAALLTISTGSSKWIMMMAPFALA